MTTKCTTGLGDQFNIWGVFGQLKGKEFVLLRNWSLLVEMVSFENPIFPV